MCGIQIVCRSLLFVLEVVRGTFFPGRGVLFDLFEVFSDCV